jgi:hypothetical protein
MIVVVWAWPALNICSQQTNTYYTYYLFHITVLKMKDKAAGAIIATIPVKDKI